MKILLFLLLLHNSIKAIEATENIRLLNWWSYLAPDVSKTLRSEYPEMLITEYRSNEIALSKILSNLDGYEIAIVSNWVARKLNNAGMLDTISLSQLTKSRNYQKKILLSETGCIPYLWSVTTFASNIKSFGKVDSITTLISNNDISKKIGIVDDIIEFHTRMAIDLNNEHCLPKMTPQCVKNISEFIKPKRKIHFISSFNEVLHKYDAVYSWHGVISQKIENLEGYKFYIPHKLLVIGGDYVCLIKNKNRSIKETKKLINLISLLTNKKNTNRNVLYTNYFSPYTNFTPEILPKKTRQLFKKSLSLLKNGKTIFVNDYSRHEITQMNKLWKKIRFRK